MKLSLEYHETGRTGLKIESSSPYEVVAYPREFLLDMVIKRQPSDYVWVAAALAYGPRLNAEYSHAPGISPSVFRAISEYLGPDSTIGARVTEAAYGRGRGGNTLLLNLGPRSFAPRELLDGGRAISLQLLDLGTWVGRLFNIDQLLFSTNASAFTTPFGRQSIGPYIAAAVLISSDWAADRIVAPISSSGDLSRMEQESIMKLCAAIGIAVEFYDVSHPERWFVVGD